MELLSGDPGAIAPLQRKLMESCFMKRPVRRLQILTGAAVSLALILVGVAFYLSNPIPWLFVVVIFIALFCAMSAEEI